MEDDNVKGRYFYLMLKENFYDSDDMVLLESMENGYLYSNILLKLYLKSLKDKGKLMYKDRIPYSVEMLSKLTRHNVDVVRRAITIFQEMGIIEILDNGAIFMLDIENYIGKSSTEADRRRKYDRRIAEEKKKLLINEKSCEKSHEHIELDININTDTDKEINNIHTSLPLNEDDVLKNEFEKLWKLYPKKVGKDKAFTKYKKYRTSKDDDYCTYEEVLNGLERYLKYIEQNTWYSPKDGSTWFNNRSWNDEYSIKEEDTPEWYDKGIRKEVASTQEREDLEKLLENYR